METTTTTTTMRRRKHEKGEGGGGGGGGGRKTTITTTTTNNNNTTTKTTTTHLLPFLFSLFLLLTTVTSLNLVAAESTPPPAGAPPVTSTIVNGSEGGGGGAGGGIVVNETRYENFTDVTKFVDGMNDWDFMGSWSKYDLSIMSETQRPLPLVPDADDQGVFICQTSQIPSTLQKQFPALHNATFALTYYAKADDGTLQMTGEVLDAEGAAVVLFNQSASGEESNHTSGTWGTDTFTLPLLAAMGGFRLRVSVLHSEAGVWAAAEMRVEGMAGPPLPPTTTTTTAPPILPPVNITTNASNVNETTTTTTTAPPGNVTTAAPPNTTTITTTTTTEGEEDVSRLESIAQAIWDAFYVFLALFCACLVALVALIVHGRCKDDEPPPAVATYNPRTASYRMDKVYDNPSYDNNAV